MNAPRGFPLLWLAATTSALGDGMRWIALPLIAVRQSTDPGTISMVTAAEQAPWLLFGLFAGVLADRYDRRVVIWCTDVCRAVLAAGFALAVGWHAATIPVIAALGFLLTCGETINGAATSGLIPALVPADRRAAANGRLQAGVLVTDTLVGSPLGALLFSVAAVVPFALDAATFLGAAVLIGLLPGRYRAAEPVTGTRRIRGEIAEGTRFLRKHRLLRVLCVLSAVNSVVFTGLVAVLVLYAGQVLHLHATGYGLLVATFAVGGIAGGLAAGRLAAVLGTRRCLLGTITVYALCSLTLGLTGSVPVAGTAIAVFGAASAVSGAVMATVRQTAVPDGLVGRVTAAFRLVNYGAAPVGAVAAGALAHAYGLRAPFLIGAGVTLAMLLVTSRVKAFHPVGSTVGYPVRSSEIP